MRYLTFLPPTATPVYGESGEQDAWVVYTDGPHTFIAYAGYAIGHAAATTPDGTDDVPLFVLMRTDPVTIGENGVPTASLPYPDGSAPLLSRSFSARVDADLADLA